MIKSPAVVLSIAGFDPSSGAGITADLKTIAAHGLFGVSCITALTVQSTQGVSQVHPVAGNLVRSTLKALLDDFQPAAVKIGMLASGEVVEAVASILEERRPPKVVLDPVLKASSGAALLQADGIRLLITRLIPMVDVITPNLGEAQELTALSVSNLPQMGAAARQLHKLGARNVVVTGGHLEEPIDVLSEGPEARMVEFAGEHFSTNSTHGTGCAFSSALACNMALGKNLEESVRNAKEYVSRALKCAYPIGKGKGPINHLFRFNEGDR
ncbi:MAG TPA: bifunctional hydroxymethylpyrimidine kinase/phosphomethylpyrimidine kinase [Terriglobales bacterium]